jgi:tetratricopeptide (TPR) repeat protein
MRPRLSYNWCEQRGLRSARWKFITGPAAELYDLAADPGERANLAAREPGICDSLASLMDAVALGARADGAYAAGREALSPQQEERLRSMGYVTTAAAPVRTEAAATAATADSVAMWGFPAAERGVALGLPSPRTTLPAYNRRLAARSHLRVGLAALGRDDLEAAEAAFRRSATVDTSFAEPHLRIAEICERNGDLRRQLHILGQAAAHFPANVELCLAYTDALIRAGRPEEARRVLEAALEAGADSPEIYERLAGLEREEGDLGAAEGLMREASRRFADSGWTWSLLALIELDLHKWEAALACAERAVSVQPDLPRAHFVQGLIGRQVGDLRTVRVAWARFLELAPQAPEAEIVRAYFREIAPHML